MYVAAAKIFSKEGLKMNSVSAKKLEKTRSGVNSPHKLPTTDVNSCRIILAAEALQQRVRDRRWLKKMLGAIEGPVSKGSKEPLIAHF